jgi:hypothetical protein
MSESYDDLRKQYDAILHKEALPLRELAARFADEKEAHALTAWKLMAAKETQQVFLDKWFDAKERAEAADEKCKTLEAELDRNFRGEIKAKARVADLESLVSDMLAVFCDLDVLVTQAMKEDWQRRLGPVEMPEAEAQKLFDEVVGKC